MIRIFVYTNILVSKPVGMFISPVTVLFYNFSSSSPHFIRIILVNSLRKFS
jgi:hypothetical protein